MNAAHFDPSSPVILNLGRGTRIQLLSVHDLKRGQQDCVIPMDYRLLTRGRLSRLAMKKTLTRWVNDALREACSRTLPEAAGALTRKQKNQIRNSHRWFAKRMCLEVRGAPSGKPIVFDDIPPNRDAALVAPPSRGPRQRAVVTPQPRHLDVTESAQWLQQTATNAKVEKATQQR